MKQELWTLDYECPHVDIPKRLPFCFNTGLLLDKTSVVPAVQSFTRLQQHPPGKLSQPARLSATQLSSEEDVSPQDSAT